MTPSSRYFTLVPRARQLLARTCFAASRSASPRPAAARLHHSASDGRPGQPVAGRDRQPPFDTSIRVQSRIRRPINRSSATRTTRARYEMATSRRRPTARHRRRSAPRRRPLATPTPTPTSTRPKQLPAVPDAGQTDIDADAPGERHPRRKAPSRPRSPSPGTSRWSRPSGRRNGHLPATATDDIDTRLRRLHAAHGQPIAIGDTTVQCNATDAGGNTANASFAITVLGPKEQLANLIRAVVDATCCPRRSSRN